MYQFFSSKSKTKIDKLYKDLYNTKYIDNKFKDALSLIPEIKNLFPKKFKGSKLLTLNFEDLSDVYYTYIESVNKLAEKRRIEINELLKKVFNYDSHRSKIRDFLSDPNNGFEIHNCVYCDIEKVEGYTRPNGRKNSKFHADHVLDKGNCPLVALSIHNFVPACPICNEAPLKGTNTLGINKSDTLKLSPKSHSNNFESEVRFKIQITDPLIPDIKLFKSNIGWEIDFDYDDNVYKQTVSMFDLKQRYNAERSYFGSYLDKKKNYPEPVIEKIASMRKIHKDDVIEELFEYNRKRNNHEPMEKCRLDLLKKS